MRKKIIFGFIFIFWGFLIFANLGTTVFEPSKESSDIFINQVKVKVEMPDSTEFVAIVQEGGDLKITMGEESYIFSPKVEDFEQKSVSMECAFNSSRKDIDKFDFEIIDIISSPIDQLQEKIICECCLTCGSTTVCACGVSMCGTNCCCKTSCCIPEY